MLFVAFMDNAEFPGGVKGGSDVGGGWGSDDRLGSFEDDADGPAADFEGGYVAEVGVGSGADGICGLGALDVVDLLFFAGGPFE